MSIGIVTAAYIAAAVLFILSLGGLSGQESAKRAVWYGIVGMALAVVATIFGPGIGNYLILMVMVVAGAYLGQMVAKRVEMTEMPQLVAALHSFVGPNFSLDRGFLARNAARTSEGMEVSMLFVATAVPLAAIVIVVHLLARLTAPRQIEAQVDADRART